MLAQVIAAGLILVQNLVVNAPNKPPAPAGYDLAGIQLGMNLTQLQAAATSHGYALVNTTKWHSFFQELDIGRKKNRGQPYTNDLPDESIRTAQYKKGPEEINIAFQEFSTGLYVKSITYRNNADDFPTDSILNLMTMKYGKPDVLTSSSATWCKLSGPGLCDNQNYPTLAVTSRTAHVEPSIKVGRMGEDELKAAIKADFDSINKGPSL